MFYLGHMDWDFAIERHRGPLLSLVLTLFAEIGLAEGGTIERLSKPLYRKVLRVLRTAESAVRRLIIVAARDIVVEPRPQRPARAERVSSDKGKAESTSNGSGQGKVKPKRGVFFKLFDPPKRLKKFFGRPPKRPRAEPRIRILDEPDPRAPIFRLFRQPEPPPAPPTPVIEEQVTVDYGTVNAIHLCRRLLAIKDALEDIPRQARRLARWRARPVEERRPQLSTPLRVGRPPGFRKRQVHEVDEILVECHWLARNIPASDSS